MNIYQLKEHYKQLPSLGELKSLQALSQSKVHLKGLVGSAAGLIAAAHLEQFEGTTVFVLEDKEMAAYFLNDLENILFPFQERDQQGFVKDEEEIIKIRKNHILFFPRSARVAYQIEQTENANVAMRASAQRTQ